MSMKRTKAKTAGKEQNGATDFWAKPTVPEATWEEASTDKPDAAFTPYAMSSTFIKGQLITHSKFGKGVVTDVETGRVEILFQDGKKKLGHAQA